MATIALKHRVIRRWFVRLQFSVLSTLLVLFLLELFVRAAWGIFHLIPSARNIDSFCFPTERVELRQGEQFTGFYEYDRQLVRRWIPNVRGLAQELLENGDNGAYITLAANEHGWRDVPHTLEKPPGIFRILVVGDSFAEPWRRPIEQGIPRQLEGWLKSRGQTQIEVVSLSISGNNPVDYSAIIHYEAPQYAPDLIVVLLYPLNDVIDNQFVDLLTQTGEQDGRVVYTPEWLQTIEKTYFDKRNSPAEDGSITWQELAAAQQEGRVVVNHESADGTRDYAVYLTSPRSDIPPHLRVHCLAQHLSYLYTWLKERVRMIADTQDELNHLGSIFPVFQSPPVPQMKTGWQQYERLLSQMAADAATQNSRIAFVTLAFGEQVYPQVMGHELERLGFNPNDYDANYPQERTRQYCDTHDFDCWFLLPAFQEAATNADTQLFDYYDPHNPKDNDQPGHYTPFGYALAASVIGEAIIEAGWLNS